MEKLKKRQVKIVLAAILVLIFFHYLGLFNKFEQGLLKLVYPLEQLLYRWGSNFGQLVHFSEVYQENQRLREEVARLSVDYVKLESLMTENKYLRAELHYLKENKYHYQLADIIGRLPYNDQVLIINQGKKAGLKEGLAATVAQGVIIGKIFKVEETRTYVELLTSTQSHLAVSLASFSGTNGLLQGRAGNNLLIDFIPQTQEVKVGELIITSGLEELIPRGLLVGEISEVISQVGKIFKQAKVNLPFNYQNLQTLTIIIPQ